MAWDEFVEGPQVAAEVEVEGDEEAVAAVTAAHVRVIPSAEA